jgi:hypothetical protein
MNKKAQKKKDREKRVRRQVLLRRAAIRAPEEEDNRLRRKMKRIAKVKKDMGERNVWSDEVLMKLDELTLTQLEKNAKILKILEEEYAQEQDKKSKLNQHLESEGCLTLEQKLNHLHQQLVEEQKGLYEEEMAKAEKDSSESGDNEGLVNNCVGDEVCQEASS